MLKFLIRGLQAGLVVKLLADYRRATTDLLRIEATACYVRGVQLARLSALGLLQIVLMVGLLGLGVLMFHIGLFILLPWSMAAKALLGMILGGGYIAAGWVALRAAFQEQAWMDKSGVTELLRKASRRLPPS
ncbi:MAG: hypothetical protein K8T26_09275 [Lentisphaerae bacterium]|nr:hypothetical protein [Lentisphaerota bacterium]